MTHKEQAARREAMAAMVAGGATVKETCSHFHLCHDSVKHACEEHGVAWRSGKDLPWKVLGRLLTTDDPVAEISKELRVPRRDIYYVITKAREVGIKVLRRRRAK